MNTPGPHNPTTQTPDVAPTQAGSAAGESTAGNVPAVSVSAAVATFLQSVDAALKTLVAALPRDVPGGAKHPRMLQPTRLRAIPLLAEMLRRHPYLRATIPVEDIDAAMADVRATSGLSMRFALAKGAIDDATRVRQHDAWNACAEIMAVAERKAKTVADVARELAEVQDILALGPRADTAAINAEIARQDVLKAQARLAKAEKRAAAKALLAASTAAQTPPVTPPPAPTGTPDPNAPR